MRGWCAVGKGQYSTPPAEQPDSTGQARSQIGAFSPEGVPYSSIETYESSPSMPFGRALLWNIQQPGSSHTGSEPCDGPRHRKGCLPLVLVLSCHAVGRLVLSACSMVVHEVQMQSVSAPRTARYPETITGHLEAGLSRVPNNTGAEVSGDRPDGKLGTVHQGQHPTACLARNTLWLARRAAKRHSEPKTVQAWFKAVHRRHSCQPPPFSTLTLILRSSRTCCWSKLAGCPSGSWGQPSQI